MPKFDFSLSLDSNIMEKIRAAIFCENIQPSDRNAVNEVLMLKRRDPRVRFDVMPFLVENFRLARDEPHNNRPLNTLIAFYMLDHLNWDAFQDDSNHFIFSDPIEDLKFQLRPKAERILNDAIRNLQQKELEKMAIQALLLRFARILDKKEARDRSSIFQELLEFSIKNLGFIPRTELYLIWNGLKSNSVAPFFGPITGKASGMLNKISGMAWDMTLLRCMETIATTGKVDAFFIPYFVTMDKSWRELLALSRVELLLIDDKNRRMLCAYNNEVEFQRELDECKTSKFQSEMTPVKIEARRRAAQSIDLTRMKQLIAEEESLLTP